MTAEEEITREIFKSTKDSPERNPWSFDEKTWETANVEYDRNQRLGQTCLLFKWLGQRTKIEMSLSSCSSQDQTQTWRSTPTVNIPISKDRGQLTAIGMLCLLEWITNDGHRPLPLSHTLPRMKINDTRDQVGKTH